MHRGERGVVAAGHPLTAEAGAGVLREGGNAVDAAVGAMLMSFVAEPLLTGLGAGGYMMVAGEGGEPALLDFFVEAPARAQDGSAAELQAIDVSFGDAVQVFHIGPASCGVYGTPAGVCEAMARWGTVPLAELAAPAARVAREGVALNHGQAYVAEILADLLLSTPECAALWAPAGHVLREGEVLRNPELGDALERLGGRARSPSTGATSRRRSATGSAARRVRSRARRWPPTGRSARSRWGWATAIARCSPTRRPPAGGTLLAYALALLDRGPAPPALEDRGGDGSRAGRAHAGVRGGSRRGGLPGAAFLPPRLGVPRHTSRCSTARGARAA